LIELVLPNIVALLLALLKISPAGKSTIFPPMYWTNLVVPVSVKDIISKSVLPLVNPFADI
jgi:hypothetical protein